MNQRRVAGHWEGIGKSAEEILNVRAEITHREGRVAGRIDAIGRVLARPAFFLAVLAAHVAWIALNLPVWPWWRPWDPYPFTFLATVASVEAPFITLLILMNQKRESRIAELREETNLQVSLHLEREVTVGLRLLRELQEAQGVRSRQDPELLERLQEYLDPQRLMDSLRRHLRQEEREARGDPTAP